MPDNSRIPGAQKPPVSVIRKTYIVRLVCRCIIFVLCALVCLYRPDQLAVLERGGFFRAPSLLHLLWLLWMIDMVCQLFPVKRKIALGSHKLFKVRFRPVEEKINGQALRSYIISTTKAAYKVFILWGALLIVLGVLHRVGVLSDAALFMVSVAFYVCDLICVLIWCPFRLMMKNRCCTTCRIFNWDHMMMITPMMFIGSFYSCSLLFMALLVWLIWELCVMMYPERFWEMSNAALQCSECTDKLCTQYCQKLRK